MDIPPEDYIHQQKPLIDLLFKKIIPLGVSQQVSVTTHRESCLDHIYTNHAEKLSNVTAERNGGSDHKVIHAVRHCESLGRSNMRYVTKRCFENFRTVYSFRETFAKVSLDLK